MPAATSATTRPGPRPSRAASHSDRRVRIAGPRALVQLGNGPERVRDRVQARQLFGVTRYASNTESSERSEFSSERSAFTSPTSAVYQFFAS